MDREVSDLSGMRHLNSEVDQALLGILVHWWSGAINFKCRKVEKAVP